MNPCQGPAESDATNWQELLMDERDMMREHDRCKAKHKAAIEALKQFMGSTK